MTPRVVIDSIGTVMDKYKYLAFGSMENGSTSSTGQDVKYTGKEWDGESGVSLYYYGARYYDPTLGRFTSAEGDIRADALWPGQAKNLPQQGRRDGAIGQKIVVKCPQ